MTQPELITPEIADFRARAFVNGLRRHEVSGKMEPCAGEFSQRFMEHPWVRDSVMEGWGRELRSHLIQAVKLRIMRKLPYDDIASLMPPKEWVLYAKEFAAQCQRAARAREELSPNTGLSVSYLLRHLRPQKSTGSNE